MMCVDEFLKLIKPVGVYGLVKDHAKDYKFLQIGTLTYEIRYSRICLLIGETICFVDAALLAEGGFGHTPEEALTSWREGTGE